MEYDVTELKNGQKVMLKDQIWSALECAKILGAHPAGIRLAMKGVEFGEVRVGR